MNTNEEQDWEREQYQRRYWLNSPWNKNHCFQFTTNKPDTVERFKEFWAKEHPEDRIEEVNEKGDWKEIEFTVQCYLSDATPMETALKLAFPTIEMQQTQLPREMNDREIPLGYYCRAKVEF